MPRLPDLVRAALLSLCAAAMPATAQAQDRESVFFWGNSLVNHVSDSPDTAVPPWLARLAEAGGHDLAASGAWGFLRDFSRDLPPESEWGFPGVTQAWHHDDGAFRMADLDTLVITPTNFIQYQAPDAPYWDDPDATPLGEITRLIDWADGQQPGARMMIYQGWADMESITSYPPGRRGLRRYHAYNIGDYHDWYVDLTDRLDAAFPETSVTLIPVARVLSELFTDSPLEDMEVEAIYVDDAPHGTPDLYFLAAMVTYASLFAEPPPAAYVPDDSLHPLIRENYPMLAEMVFAATSGLALQEARLRDPAAAPSLGMGLNGIADWSTQVPFVDVMKTARPWIGHEGDAYGAWTFERLLAEGYLSPEGWPTEMPPNVTRIETFLLTELPPGATDLAGRYRVTWQGAGWPVIGAGARDVSRPVGNEMAFTFRPGEGTVAIGIERIDPADPIRDIQVVREDLIPLHDLGVVFDPAWQRLIADFRVLRFMDWMDTNHSTQASWSDRPLTTDFSYAWRGVPVEVMLELANTVGADPWFTLPHRADDAYVAAFAMMVKDGLEPRLGPYVEHSNELWNWMFTQTHDTLAAAEARWGVEAGEAPHMQYAGMRAAEVMDIWTEVWGDEADRLTRVIGTQTGWPGLEEPMLAAPLAVADGHAPPVESFDAYAVTGYFGSDLGQAERLDDVLGWAARDDGFERAAAALRRGSFDALLDEYWPYHADVAARHGLRLIAYEGGTHVAGVGEMVENEAVTAFFTAFNYSPEMGQLHVELLQAWRELGGETFAAFVDVAPPSRWGSWGALRHRGDLTPRWAALRAANAMRPAWGAERPAEDFAAGVILRDVGGAVPGTPGRDVILAARTDDRIMATPGDRIDGGGGNDVVVLAGTSADWQVVPSGAISRVFGAGAPVVLRGVEGLEFGDGTTLALGQEG